MKIYRLETIQKLPISQKKAWDFLSDPKNLKTITPDYMGFEIMSGEADTMYAGQIIQYVVRPLFGIPTTWVTEITHINEGSYFVDEQRVGPYDLWHHKHFIKPIKDYKIPMGILGIIIHPIIVAPKLKEIFEYRKNALIKLFGTYKL